MVFIKRAFKNYQTIGSLIPSSIFLYKKMTKPINFSKDINIIEYGPGNGVFTDKLLKNITINSKISIFELDKGFCKLLREKYKNESRITIYELSACKVKDFFEKESVDYIVSSLPFSFMKDNIVGDILERSKQVLKKEGKYIQFQYFLQNKKQIKSYFSKIDYNFTALNFPPAFVYICHK